MQKTQNNTGLILKVHTIYQGGILNISYHIFLGM